MEEEIWKSVPGLEGTCEASSLGNIRTIDRQVPYHRGPYTSRFVKGVPIVMTLSRTGYCRVSFDGNGYLLHRLVAFAFHPNADNKPQVNHKNGVKTDNRAENLEWATCAENKQHAVAVLGHCQGANNGRAKLTETDVLDIRATKAFGANHSVLARAYGVTPTLIRNIVTRRLWQHF